MVFLHFVKIFVIFLSHFLKGYLKKITYLKIGFDIVYNDLKNIEKKNCLSFP